MRKLALSSVFFLLSSSFIACGPPETPPPATDGGNNPPPPPSLGAVQVTTSIAGAVVILDGANTGKLTPTTLTEVTAGDREVDVKLVNYVSLKRSVTVAEGATSQVRVPLARNLTGVWQDVDTRVMYRVFMTSPPNAPGELWAGGFQPFGFHVEGDTLSRPGTDWSAGTGTVSQNGTRLDYTTIQNAQYVFVKVVQ